MIEIFFPKSWTQSRALAWMSARFSSGEVLVWFEAWSNRRCMEGRAIP